MKLACARDSEALVGVEVAVHRDAVFVDGRIAAGEGRECAVTLADVEAVAREAYRQAGYGASPAGLFVPAPEALRVSFDLCLDPLGAEERAARSISDDQAICVGHAVWGPRAGHRPLEQALASDFAKVLESLREQRPDLGLGPDGKTLVAVKGRTLVGVSLSLQHAPRVDWIALTREARKACETIAEIVLSLYHSIVRCILLRAAAYTFHQGILKLSIGNRDMFSVCFPRI